MKNEKPLDRLANFATLCASDEDAEFLFQIRDDIKEIVAKYERVARAVKAYRDSGPSGELWENVIQALADLPEDALK